MLESIFCMFPKTESIKNNPQNSETSQRFSIGNFLEKFEKLSLGPVKTTTPKNP